MAFGLKVEEKTVSGEKVFIKTLTGGKHSTRIIEMLPQLTTNPGLMVELGSLLMACCICDANGKPTFESPEQAGESASMGFILEFVEVALDHCGLKDDAEQIKKKPQQSSGKAIPIPSGKRTGVLRPGSNAGRGRH